MAVAKDEGLDETTAQQAFDAPEQLGERHQAALALADALMTQPRGVDRDRVRAQLTDEQIVELTLDVMKWNYQKVMVALGTDPEVRPGQLVDLVFDDAGHWVRPT